MILTADGAVSTRPSALIFYNDTVAFTKLSVTSAVASALRGEASPVQSVGFNAVQLFKATAKFMSDSLAIY